MNIVDAVRRLQVDSSCWARPVGWIGQAIFIRDGCLTVVPDLRGGRLWTGPYAKDVAGEWEVVSPDQVNSENERRK